MQEDGHRVRLATHSNFKDFVLDAGLEFFPLGGDAKLLASWHTHVAELLKVPLHMIFTIPWTVTSEFPHPFTRVKQPAAYRVRMSWPNLATNYEPPTALLDWLRSGDAPIYIGFGSLVSFFA
ncbi:unnamed protein product [Linum tenue]|uniref:Uncharacterized protein n=1 Tax=Linum tenue TaxID=586396 RepID=A0AAV0RQR2_9ROSI|nr:unnamed protein product [Linum tenue]